MLELSMDMEADLGIDSIKRVEILGAVQEQIPELPELNPDDLAELRTLGQIVDYMQSKAPAASVSTAAVGTAPAGVDLEKINSVMLAVVADKTGYPAEMLELSMDMEADLGIDSIKRVEILGAVQDDLPELPELNPDDLAELRTLGQIVDYMQSKAPAGAPASAAPVAASASAGVDMAKINATMLSVVADKTGYPAEMLELSMDMEADLGIDSIKRVEILGAVQDELPELPELNPDDLAELRTLGQIVDYMQSKAPAGAPASAAPVAASASAGVDMAKINATMMSVVADKTGYPSEMLELSMDMEADLGIDSIKRVEILGAVQDELPELPELNPDDLAELRTLGQIVEYMQSKAPASQASVPAAAPVSVAAPAAGAGLDVAAVTQVMMKVVAEKTGYPVEMLESGMDMEADLGIDSIKRVEILGAVQDDLPELPELNPDAMAELRTLGQIIDYMQSNAPAAAVVPASAASVAEVAVATVTLEQLTPTMLAVVGEKTGYPVEMLELDMDMEADLGIDSIKRVEILGAVQDAFPEMPEINPDVLADLRTLREIVNAMSNTSGFAKGAAQAVATATAEAASHAPSNTVAVKLLAAADLLDLQLPEASVALLTDEGTTLTAGVAKGLIAKGWNVAVLQQPKAVIAKRAKLPKEVKTFELADSSEQALEAALESITETVGSVRAVIHLQPSLNNAAGKIDYPANSKAILLTAFLLAKHLKVALNDAANTGSRAAFITVPRMDGQLGYGDANDADLVQGGLCGLTKTVNLEWPSVFCRVVDIAPGIKAQQAADNIIAELYDANSAIPEIGYSAKGRVTLVPEATDSYALTQGNSVSADSVFLVSGGAKGVTTKCVEQLASQFGSKFILLGRSEYNSVEPEWAAGCSDEGELKQRAMKQLIANGDKPTPVKIQQFMKPLLSDREIGAALAAIEAAGGKAIYIAADVTDAAALKAKVQPAVDQLGAITGLVHGAGVLADRYIEQKTVADFEAVYTTKISGMQAMLACVDADSLKHLVVFSSAAGFYGNTGQSDYSVANDILNKTALRFKQQHPSCQVLSFNWGPWDGGMVTPELKRMFAERGVYVIPLDAGAQLFANELSAADNRCPQILIGNDMSGGDEAAADTGVTPGKKPLASRLSRVITVEANPFIADHVIGGNPVVPTVCATGWMASACEALYPGYRFQAYDNYKLFKGIIFDGSEAAVYNMDVERSSADSAQTESLENIVCKVQIWSENAKGMRINHYGANITLVAPGNRAEAPLYVADLSDETLISGESLYNDGTLFHGPRFQGIDAVLNHSAQKLTLLCTAKDVPAAEQGQFPVGVSNAYVDDLMFQAMLVWARLYHQAGSLPSQAKQLDQYAVIAPGQSFYLSLDVVSQSSSNLVADITLHDEHGVVYARMSSGEVTISKSLNKLFAKES
jgi:polyketide-type polyunsaturated fatty acid synthase PfaA